MAVLHKATLSPTKPELLQRWVPTRPWAPAIDGDIGIIGAYRFDDPDGEVGLEVHLVNAGEVVLQVPLTYRAAPIAGADDHLVSTMRHSVLGDRWVYDGIHDPAMVRMLAAAAMTGTGQAIGMVHHDGRWSVVPVPIQLGGGGWTGGPADVDGFAVGSDGADGAVLRSDSLELRVARRPVAATPSPSGLTATWPGQAEPVVLAEIEARPIS